MEAMEHSLLYNICCITEMKYDDVGQPFLHTKSMHHNDNMHDMVAQGSTGRKWYLIRKMEMYKSMYGPRPTQHKA